MGKVRLGVLMVWLFPLWAMAQSPLEDSTFRWNQLGNKDLIQHPPKENQKIYAANRIPEHSDELPVRTYIITNEEINLNGYTTLVDVLKTLPGFRTSQPSSALYGETFTMRGLFGNVYTKILINGSPVKPFGAPGMPLGAQLPIRQAERIEIVLGPASSLYGSDAMGGIVNIVLPEVDRPMEVTGSVVLNSGLSDEVHLSLGGKLGKDRNVFKYMFYGSSKRTDNLDIDISQFVVDDTLTYQSPFYLAEEEDISLPEIRDLSHESRIVGAQVNFRGLMAGVQALYRRDHSALGAHPGVVSYSDPSTYTAEFIYNYNLQYNANWGKHWSSNTNASYLNYAMDNNSSYVGIDHPISNDRNFMYGASNDLLVEQLVNYTNKRFNVLVGGSYFNSSGPLFHGYLGHPFDDDQIRTDSTGQDYLLNSFDQWSWIDSLAVFDEFNLTDIAGFTQVYYKAEKFNLIGGLRYDVSQRDDEGVVSPKFGALYKLTDDWRVRCFYSQSFRRPTPYFINDNYWMQGSPPGQPPQAAFFKQRRQRLSPENMTSIEFGTFRDINENLRVELHYYWHELSNSIFNRADFPPDTASMVPPGQEFFVGSTNTSSRSVLQAFQAFANYKSKIVDVDFSLQYNIGEEFLDTITDVDSYRSMPEFMGQLNLHFTIAKTNRLSLYNKYVGNFVGGIALSNGQLFVQETAGFFNLDMVFTKVVNRNFLIQGRMYNVLNNINKGIFTTWKTGYELPYVPQFNRTFSVGLTYTLR